MSTAPADAGPSAGAQAPDAPRGRVLIVDDEEMNRLLLPVVMLTAVTQQSVKVEGLELGVSDYLTKPFNPPELRARVRNLVRLRAQELELSRINAVLAHEALSDSLTGLANRRGFDEHFRRELSRAQRYGAPIALALFDIDHFKRINDQFGHPVGDECLWL